MFFVFFFVVLGVFCVFFFVVWGVFFGFGWFLEGFSFFDLVSFTRPSVKFTVVSFTG